MHTLTTTTSVPTTISLTNFDSDKLLHLLLKSIPSAQTRLDLKPYDIEAEMVDELRATPAPTPALSQPAFSSVTMERQSTLQTSTMGIFAKIGALFGHLTGIKVEDEDDGSTIRSEDIQSPESNTTSDSDVEEELEVEYMLIAERCVAAPTAYLAGGEKRKITRPHRRRKRGSSCAASIVNPAEPTSAQLLASPPVIHRKRKEATTAGGGAKRKRKRGSRRGVPGFK